MIRWHSLIYDIDRGHGKDIRAKSPTCVITTIHSPFSFYFALLAITVF